MYVVRNGQTAISLTYCLSLYVLLSHQSGLSALVISARMEDKSNIHLRRNSLCEKINNVLYYFSHCDPFVKVQYYCCSVLWNLSQPDVEDICTAWRKGLRRVWVSYITLIPHYCIESVTFFHLNINLHTALLHLYTKV